MISRLVPDTWQTVLQSDCPLFFFSSLSPARSENLTLQSLRALPRCQDTPENTPRRRNRSAHTEPLHRFPQAVQPEDSAPGPSRSPLLPQRKNLPVPVHDFSCLSGTVLLPCHRHSYPLVSPSPMTGHFLPVYSFFPLRDTTALPLPYLHTHPPTENCFLSRHTSVILFAAIFSVPASAVPECPAAPSRKMTPGPHTDTVHKLPIPRPAPDDPAGEAVLPEVPALPAPVPFQSQADSKTKADRLPDRDKYNSSPDRSDLPVSDIPPAAPTPVKVPAQPEALPIL